MTFTLNDGTFVPSYAIMNNYFNTVNGVTMLDACQKDAFILKPLSILVNDKKTQIGTYYVCQYTDGSYTYIYQYDDALLSKALEGFKPKAMTYAKVETYLKSFQITQ